jgi:hypothetical protein
MPVLKIAEFTQPVGDRRIVTFWCAYPNNNPDIFVTWLIRPAYPPGHLTHPGHSLRILATAVGREPTDPGGRPRYTFEVEHTGFGAHFNIVEVFVFWERI